MITVGTTLLVLVLAIWVWRERSWSAHDSQLHESQVDLTDLLTNVYSLSVGGADALQCLAIESGTITPQNSRGECSLLEVDVDATIALPEIRALLESFPYIVENFKSSARIIPVVKLFKTHADWLIIAFMVGLMQYELRCHATVCKASDVVEADVVNKYTARHRHLMHARQYPFSNLCFFSGIFLLSSIGWLGSWVAVDRQALTKALLRLCLFWIVANVLSCFVDNYRSLRMYLPHSFSEAKESMKSWEWWKWSLPRLFVFGRGIDQLAMGYSGLHVVVILLATWPLRYFYFNLESSCGVTARYTDVFLCRMLMHLSFLIMVYSYLSLAVLGFPFIKKTPVELSVHATTNAAMVNSALALLSALWFAIFGGGCGWWAALVALSFLNLHILAFVTISMTVTAQIHRQHEYWLNARAVFVEAYTQRRMRIAGKEMPQPPSTGEDEDGEKKEKKKQVSDETKAQLEELVKDLDREGDYLFDELMDGICGMYLWLPVEQDSEKKEYTVKEGMDPGAIIFQIAAEDYIKLSLLRSVAKGWDVGDAAKAAAKKAAAGCTD